MALDRSSESPPPVRPTSWATANFENQNFVRWFHPVELVRAGVHALLGDLFGSYADKRELQAALHPPAPPGHEEHDYSSEAGDGDGNFWFDFVADVGDGFNATYSVALLLARERLPLASNSGAELITPRGRFLLMGGDEVYPTASRESYLNRTVGPYRAAFPHEDNERLRPHLFALPGNHDWYDGLSAFLKQFAQPRWIGAWSTQQRRSYFVIKLPQRYWLWAIDIQLHADIDGPQIDYFDDAASRLEPGDRVILSTAEPSWVKAEEGRPAGFENLQLIMRKITGRGAEISAVLTGDSHHYARYDERVSGIQFITAGGGGAFLHGTHGLPPRIPFSPIADGGVPTRLELVTRFPSAADSRRLIGPQMFKFPLRNRAFVLMWGVLWLMLGWSLWKSSLPTGPSSVEQSVIGALANTLSASHLNALLPTLLVLLMVAVAGVALRVALPILDTENIANSDSAGAGRRRPGPSRTTDWQMWVDLAIWAAAASIFALLHSASDGQGPSSLGVLLRALLRNPGSALTVGALILGSAAYVSRGQGRFWLRFLLGCAHAVLYVLSFLLAAVLLAKLAMASAAALAPLTGCLATVTLELVPGFWLLFTATLAAPLSALLFAGFLWFAGQYRRALLNDAFSAIGVEDFKNFLRIRIGSDGALHLFAIGIEKVPTRWRFDPKNAANKPFIVPETGDVEYRLIETVDLRPRALPSPHE